jgi:hypothetical protein
LVGHKTPTELDPNGEFFTFEENVVKSTGGSGRADVWYKGHFAWEYKGKLKDLDAAYAQILSYKTHLENPPLLVVCDFLEYRIYPQWTNMDAKPIIFRNEDLANPDRNAIRYLEWLLNDPEQFRIEIEDELAARERITRNLAQEFSHLAGLLRNYQPAGQTKWTPAQIARCLNRVLFLLFAEDIKLLPRIETKTVFRYILDSSIESHDAFVPAMRELFEALDERRTTFMLRTLPYFNGSLFAAASDEGDLPDVLDITTIPGAVDVLRRASDAGWARVNPTIFGTMFEGALDPGKRAQLGAHYTSEADIRLVLEPVLMLPLNREWEAVQAEAAPHLQTFVSPDTTPRATQLAQEQLIPLYERMISRLEATTVLDPACGSGNFLYMSLRLMKDLERKVQDTFKPLGLPFRDVVTPRQFYGIEKDEFAASLAHVVLWIGYLQWRYEKEGELHPKLPNKPATIYDLPHPILRDKDRADEPDRILNNDAILRYDADGKPYEPEWVAADVIVGNPPFLGDKKMLGKLGDDYVRDLRELYKARVAGGANFVTYWFEKARRSIQERATKRADLLSTTSIRKGKSNLVLRAIKNNGDIFLAWSDEKWVLEGAQVRVVIVGFDDGSESAKSLDGKKVNRINADLTSEIDLTQVKQLVENLSLECVGDQKGGAFDISENDALALLASKNISGSSNSDVVRKYVVSQDVANRWSRKWIIDFGDLSYSQAAQYEAPMALVEQKVKPVRLENADRASRERWWLHQRPRPELRAATRTLVRYIATPRVAKHRLFVWLDSQVIPDSRILAIFREDDYFFRCTAFIFT